MARLILDPLRLDGAAGRAEACRLFRSTAPVAVDIGLGAHAGGYPTRLQEALADTYEAVARWIGEPAFAGLARRYAAAHPSTSYNLNDFGSHLARFLRRDPLGATYPFLPDLASLEWKVLLAFHAGSGTEPGTPDLAGASVDDLARVTLAMPPGVALLRSQWPVATLWRDKSRDAPGRLSSTVHPPTGGAENVAIFRAGLVVRVRRLENDEFRALRAAARGESLAAVLEAAFDRGTAPERIAAWPAQWRKQGIVTGWRRAIAGATTASPGTDASQPGLVSPRSSL